MTVKVEKISFDGRGIEKIKKRFKEIYESKDKDSKKMHAIFFVGALLEVLDENLTGQSPISFISSVICSNNVVHKMDEHIFSTFLFHLLAPIIDTCTRVYEFGGEKNFELKDLIKILNLIAHKLHDFKKSEKSEIVTRTSH